VGHSGHVWMRHPNNNLRPVCGHINLYWHWKVHSFGRHATSPAATSQNHNG